ncbi:MAG: hypothetical protein ACYSTI_14340 [Planctomycetota bacterium]|jgi:hypothetical protein
MMKKISVFMSVFFAVAVLVTALLLGSSTAYAQVSCDTETQGYWYRQCLGLPASSGGIDPGRNGRGPSNVQEPNFESTLIPGTDVELENLGFFGVLTCEGMDADPPNDPCERALKQLTALLLNVESGRLDETCELDTSPICISTTVGDLIDEVAGLILQGGEDCVDAGYCAAVVNEGGVTPPD